MELNGDIGEKGSSCRENWTGLGTEPSWCGKAHGGSSQWWGLSITSGHPPSPWHFDVMQGFVFVGGGAPPPTNPPRLLS